MTIESKEFKPSVRMKALFGFDAEQEVSYEDTINQILPEYVETVTQAIDVAIVDGLPFNIKYPIAGYIDQRIRWLRAIGKRYEVILMVVRTFQEPFEHAHGLFGFQLISRLRYLQKVCLIYRNSNNRLN